MKNLFTPFKYLYIMVRMRKGFTLVEMLLFTGVVALMVGAVVSVAIVSSDISGRSESSVEVEQNGTALLQQVKNEVEKADFVVYPEEGRTGNALLMVDTGPPLREVLIDKYHDAVRIVEDADEVNYLTTNDVSVSQIVFLNQASDYAGGGGVSTVLQMKNKAVGTAVSEGSYTKNFRSSVALHPDVCVSDSDCSSGVCCAGTCRPACLSSCVPGDCTGSQVCCITDISSGTASCTDPASCANAECGTVDDCPVTSPYFLVDGAVVFCDLATCEYKVPTCSDVGKCDAIAIGPCDVCSNCGDGSVDAAIGEECDDANADNSDSCTNACKYAECGDGIVQPLGMDGASGGGDDEECDDGNAQDNDGCSNACLNENLCFNGAPDGNLDRGEECDDGNGIAGDQCDNFCRVTFCGDDVIQSPNGRGEAEACDDGNVLSMDGCSESCVVEGSNECGNWLVENPEQCDDGGRCNNTGNFCYTDADCPSGGTCGTYSGDGCTGAGASCVPSSPDEVSLCTDGLDNDCDGSIDCADTDCAGDPACAPPPGSCGDWNLDAGEECDDGNTADGDGCSATCTNENLCGVGGCATPCGLSAVKWSVTFNTISNGSTCSTCSGFNTTFELMYNTPYENCPGSCSYCWGNTDTFNLCDGDVFELYQDPSGWWLEKGSVSYSQTAEWNCNAPNIMQLDSFGQECTGWPQTVTVTPAGYLQCSPDI